MKRRLDQEPRLKMIGKKQSSFADEENPTWAAIDREVLQESFQIFERDREQTQSDLRKTVIEILQAVNEAVSNTLLEAFDQATKILYTSSEMKSLIKEHKLDFGKFTVESGKMFNQSRPKGIGRAEEESVIVIFQLPKPLKNWWWKGGDHNRQDPDYKKNDISVVAWGEIYARVLGALWTRLRNDARQHDLNLNRLNDVGVHTEDYYYIWSFEKK